ncbi:MAG TPA: peptidylprolyl isomerase [Gaiellaceae bacterium]|jgi:parvulin-like peptidyl-prolyl isomerase|nr:peptidylprolyl isomerase [Gaiellaceae bacterium]
MRRSLRIALPLVVLAALAAAGCGGGGGSTKVPGDAVAVVGDQTITKADFDLALNRTKRGYKQQHRAWPKAGTTQFQQIRQSVLNYLVQTTELEQKAKELGVKVSDKQINDRLAQIRKQLGGEKNLKAQAKANGLTLADVRNVVIRPQLLSEGIYNKVTGSVKVSDKDVEDYYKSHIKIYRQPESRDVRHILVSNRALANKLFNRIKAGADFAKLAKKYSKDPGSAAQGGKLTIVKGQTAGPFDQTAFLLSKGQVSRPVKTQYGWHIIEAISDVKPAKTTPLKDVKDAIKNQLEGERKRNAMTKWVNDTKKEYAKKIHYQVGYAPPTTSTASTTT